jgi:cell division protein FtsQ
VGVEETEMELSLPFPSGAPRGRPHTGKRSRRVRAHTGNALDLLRRNPTALRMVVCAAVALPLLGGGWLWLRHSSLVGVRHIHIAGVHGSEAMEIRTALDVAAGRMTTMDFDVGALRAAVARYPVVGEVSATTSFPHTVSISVRERPPVAALVSAGQRTAVAGDGTVLGPMLLSSSLPVVSGTVEPAPGARLREAAPLAAVTVLGAAPGALARFVTRVYEGAEGLTVAMRNGLLVYFGDATRPHAKWLSLARVLVSPTSAGAWYVDVRLPERPAAGLSSVSSTASATPVGVGASDPTAAALAASLASAVEGGPGAATLPATTPSTEEQEASSTSSEASYASGSEATSSGGSEASPPSTGEASTGAVTGG